MSEPGAEETALLAAVERIARAAAAPAITPEQERDKANAILRGLAAERALSLPVPAALGGHGLPIAAAARLVASVATVSGSAALICAMHLAQTITLVRHGLSEALQDFLRRQVAQQILVASGTSEVGVGGDIHKSLCATEPDGAGGFRLTKSAANISYLDQAGAILATAMHADGSRSVQRLILLEASGFTCRVDRETLLMGMRGIVNRAVTIEAGFPAAAIFPEPFTVVARVMSAASHILWAAAWSGLAAAALDKVPERNAGRIGAAADGLYTMHALIRDACTAFDGAGGGSAFRAATRFNSLKITCAGLASQIVADCAAAAGFAGYAEGGAHSLSEIIRDSFSARIMISDDRLSGANAAVRRFVAERI